MIKKGGKMPRNMGIIMILLLLSGCFTAYKQPSESGYYGKVKLDKGGLERSTVIKEIDSKSTFTTKDAILTVVTFYMYNIFSYEDNHSEFRVTPGDHCFLLPEVVKKETCIQVAEGERVRIKPVAKEGGAKYERNGYTEWSEFFYEVYAREPIEDYDWSKHDKYNEQFLEKLIKEENGTAK